MKWVTGMLTLLAIVSGCVSLNKGSDQVAFLGQEKAPAEGRLISAAPEAIVKELRAAEAQRDGARRETDLTAGVSVASLPPGPDLLGERTATRVVRASRDASGATPRAGW
jgi:hypothetical protein